MLALRGNNVNEILPVAMIHFSRPDELIESSPRGQRRWQYPTPISTMYTSPCERVLFSNIRDANPYFHFMDALWLLAGRNDVAFLSQWLESIKDYSDNGVIFHGAYGYRLRRENQINTVINRLVDEPDTTRAVLQMYDFQIDAHYKGKDLPCNVVIMLGVQNGKLNMTVCNRSNDMIWGAYGANVVQFSMLLEYLAAMVGVDVGWYIQMSNNAHVYPDNDATKRLLAATLIEQDYYSHDGEETVKPFPMGIQANPVMWNMELMHFMNGNTNGFLMPFFAEVVVPMKLSHTAYKRKEYEEAYDLASNIVATDWRLACMQWLERRAAKREAS